VPKSEHDIGKVCARGSGDDGCVKVQFSKESFEAFKSPRPVRCRGAAGKSFIAVRDRNQLEFGQRSQHGNVPLPEVPRAHYCHPHWSINHVNTSDHWMRKNV